MTIEQLRAIAQKYFREEQLLGDNLDLNSISPLEMLEFILDIEEQEKKVIPSEKIKSYNFKDLETICNIINT